jgi:hypothetical protein
VEVLEWYNRLMQAYSFYNNQHDNDAQLALAGIPVTRVVLKKGGRRSSRSVEGKVVYEDDGYTIVQLPR